MAVKDYKTVLNNSAMSLINGNTVPIPAPTSPTPTKTTASPSTAGSAMSLINGNIVPIPTASLPSKSNSAMSLLNGNTVPKVSGTASTVANGTAYSQALNEAAATQGSSFLDKLKSSLATIQNPTGGYAETKYGTSTPSQNYAEQKYGIASPQKNNTPTTNPVTNTQPFDDTYDNGGYVGEYGYAQKAQDPTYTASMNALQSDMANAQTVEQKALIESAMDQLNNSYGVTNTDAGASTPGTASRPSGSGNSGAGNGTAGNAAPGSSSPIGTTPTPGSVTTPVAGDTNSAGLAGVAKAPGEFSYNLYDDPDYLAYRKQYLAAGDRASENALGQAAAASAGRVSSSAVTAATQAGDYYAHQMADQIPTLEQNAYQRYLTEQEAAAERMQNTYNNITSLIASSGYMPTDEELAAAGMNREQAEGLYYQWVVENPVAALTAGKIDGNQYTAITGQAPPGTPTYSGGGSSKDNDFYDKYWILVNDNNVTAADINNWLVENVNAKNVSAEQARLMLVTPTHNRSKAYDDDVNR